jgi:hypothetical protein
MDYIETGYAVPENCMGERALVVEA